MKFQYISHRLQLIRSFYSGIGKTTVLYPSAFFTATGTGTVALGIIFYIREIFSATPSQIGNLAALWSFIYVGGCLFIRPLFSRVLPRYLLIASVFLMSIEVSLILFVHSLPFVFLLYGLWGLSLSLFWPPLMGWLSQGIEGKQLSRVMSNYNFSWSIGTIISPFIAGMLSAYRLPAPLLLGALLFLITESLLTGASLILPRIKTDRWLDITRKMDLKKEDHSTPLRFPSWVGIFSTYTVLGVVLNIFPVYAQYTLGFGKGLVGIVLQQRAIFATIGFILLGRVNFWHFKPIYMIIGQIVLAVSVFMLRFTFSPVGIGMVLAIIGFVMSLNYFSSIFHGVSGSSRRSGRMAIHESILSVGLITGSIVGGRLFQEYSMDVVYLFCTIVVLVILVIQLLLVFFIQFFHLKKH